MHFPKPGHGPSWRIKSVFFPYNFKIAMTACDSCNHRQSKLINNSFCLYCVYIYIYIYENLVNFWRKEVYSKEQTQWTRWSVITVQEIYESDLYEHRKTVSIRVQNYHEGEMMYWKVFNFEINLKLLYPEPKACGFNLTYLFWGWN